MRYWVYVHDMDGELLDDCGEFTSFEEALSIAANVITNEPEFTADYHTIRIVDNLAEGTTIWMAAPVTYIKSIAGTYTDA